MKLADLHEGRNVSCIVVDVQPAYDKYADEIPQEIMLFLNNQRGRILMFVNAESESGRGSTEDNIGSIKEYWEDNGFDPENWNRVTVNDKGYGYLRPWMDLDVPPAIIIKVIRMLYQNKMFDSRQLFGGSWEFNQGETGENYKEELMKLGIPEEVTGEAINVGWTSIAQLKDFDRSYIMGGSRNECLREVELLMNAFNIKYIRKDNLVYG
jgi:hypothetical protein